jgi:peptidoglycan hydrolase-like protein with peptidoglycan-binding domain
MATTQAQSTKHPTIKLGDKGPAVKLAQKRLVDRGYAPLAQDGIYGAQTRRRVRAYQTDRHNDTHFPLAVDGIVGPKTWARLDPPTIKRGDDGNAVRLLQELLGHYEFVVGKIEIDGDFGPATEKAVRSFQEYWGTLTVDGIAGPATWTALWS